MDAAEIIPQSEGRSSSSSETWIKFSARSDIPVKTSDEIKGLFDFIKFRQNSIFGAVETIIA